MLLKSGSVHRLMEDEMGKVTQLPVNNERQEHVEYVSVNVFPYYEDDNLNLRIELQTNVEKYGHNKIIPKDVLKSHFDQIFDQAKEEIRRFIAGLI
jgi:hypothetical protein